MATLITIEKLSKAYGPRVIFNDAVLSVHEKQKIGVIGRNGAGKSTLFRLIIGEEAYDSGAINIHDVARLGYLAQHDNTDPKESVIAYLERTTDKAIWQCAKVVGKFEIKNELLEAPLGSLSGGYVMRVKLAAMLLKEPNLFLLDEPTNYLDVETQLLLEQYLQNFAGSFMIISHDREFLKRTCEQTLEIEQGAMYLYPGPIDEYLEYKEERLAFAKLYNKKIEREQRHLQAFVDRFRYKATKAKQAQSKLKAIERLKKVEINHPLSTVRIAIPQVEQRKGLLLRCRHVSIGYPDKTVAKDVHLDIDRGEHIAIVGNNGQGKTTFMKTLAGALPVLDGSFTWTPDTRLAYYAQHVPEELPKDKTIWSYLREQAPLDINDEDVLKMAGNFLFSTDEVVNNIGILSGGERARLCLAGILLSKSNVLLLDEPTNHLDFETVEALGRALEDFVGAVLFISHNRTFVNSVATRIIEVGEGKVSATPFTYEEYVDKLANTIIKEMADSTSNQIESQNQNADRDKHNKIKEARKQLRKIEEVIEKLETSKQKLASRQEKRPEKFLPKDYAEFGNIMRELEEQEKNWLTLQALIEENK